MTKKKTEQEIVPAEAKKEVATVAPTNFMDEVSADAETFKEVLTQDDMSVPFLVILQALSPACTEGDGAYQEGARPGMLMSTTTGELFDVKKDKLVFQAISYKASFIEWVPRSTGAGGFVAEHAEALGLQGITVRNEDNGEDIIQPNSPCGTPGNQLSYTHTHFVNVINIKTSEVFQAVITMTSSQLKPSRNLNSMINNLKLPGKTLSAPRFYGVWEASTELRTKGDNKWQVWSFSKHGNISELENGEDLYRSAKEFRVGLEAGAYTVDHNVAEKASENPDVDPQAHEGEQDEEIPF